MLIEGCEYVLPYSGAGVGEEYYKMERINQYGLYQNSRSKCQP